MFRLSQIAPIESRSRGSLMSCDPTATVLTVNAPYGMIEALLCRDSKGPIFDAMRRAKTLQIFSRTEIFSAVSASDKEHYCILHHELDHLRRQFSNSLGFLELHLNTVLVASARRLMADCAECEMELPFPLLGPVAGTSWFQDAVHDPEKMYAACDGRGNSTATAVLAMAAAASIRGLEFGSQKSFRGLCDLGFTTVKSPPRLFSQGSIDPNVDEFIGASHLYEHMAVLQELSCRIQFGANINSWLELSQSDPRYRIIGSLWNRFFGHVAFLDQGELPETDIITEAYKLYPLEFYAMLDLALWVPFGPQGFAAGCCWNDLQPGRRFARLLATSKALKGDRLTRISSLSVDERNERFTEIQSWLAGLLGWPSPTELAANWLAYLTAEKWEEDGLLIRAKHGFTLAIAKAMLAERSNKPFDTVCNNRKWVLTDEISWFSHCLSYEKGVGHTIHSISDDVRNDAARDEFFTYRGCCRMLFDTIGVIDSLEHSSREQMLQSMSALLEFDATTAAYWQQVRESLFG